MATMITPVYEVEAAYMDRLINFRVHTRREAGEIAAALLADESVIGVTIHRTEESTELTGNELCTMLQRING